ncbi:hypothetical protein [Streptacidiphilus neutrinimicus]|uniref:hypothetical protein n=1 Tax=Streptacidiphilus neutrinimicus TaxID=105420 RepID=UPI0005A77106|nr:hypothetical protein [Streptacidiphilus neutrinimicus]
MRGASAAPGPDLSARGGPEPSARGVSDDPEPARRLDGLYATPPPWEIGRPKQAFLGLARRGALVGRVRDVGWLLGGARVSAPEA